MQDFIGDKFVGSSGKTLLLRGAIKDLQRSKMDQTVKGMVDCY